KSVIAVPRLEEFGEHIDDHQIEVASVLESEGYLKSVIDIKDLYSVIKKMKENPVKKKYNKKSKAINIIRDFIKNN
ncbi:MAG TPA: glycosyltransferase, partial [Chitinophagaceae bacterium]|nr:glycosyltransferase [Chitinophagaceae bacterium]